MEACLTTENLEWTTPTGRILGRGITLALKAGELLWIQGPNGSGKSTLIHTLLGDLKPKKGRVQTHLRPDEIGYLPQVQNRECHIPLTLREVIGLAHRQSLPHAHWGLLDEAQLDLAWNQASGGERQRTLFLRELVSAPKLLFLDEPLNHLDETSKIQMQATLAQLLTEEGAPALILVSHGGLGLAQQLPHGGYRLDLSGDGSAQLSRIQKLEERLS
jgi:ABC-type Mn2+/Zn2+ transport system ATPase subunit